MKPAFTEPAPHHQQPNQHPQDNPADTPNPGQASGKNPDPAHAPRPAPQNASADTPAPGPAPAHAPHPSRDDLLTPQEAAELFRVSPKTIARWADEGKLRALRTPGGNRRYYRTDLHTLLTP